MSGTVRFVTVSTRSHLAGAAVLADSLERVHPGVERILFLAEPAVEAHDRTCGWTVRPACELPLPEPARFLFQYTPFQLCCALKSFALHAVLDEPGVAGAVYLDTDMLAQAPFLDMVAEAWRQGDVALTPHLRTLAPCPNFHLLLRVGAYNAGFLAVRRGADGMAFLAWMEARMDRDCIRDYPSSLYDDQKWLDVAAATCPGVHPLRDAGLNAGPWNLHELSFAAGLDGIRIDGRTPLRLFHFSGLLDDALSRHAKDRAVPPALTALAAAYRRDLAAAAARFPPDAPYGFGRFADGQTIKPLHREAVRSGRATVVDPFADRTAVEAATRGLAMPYGWLKDAHAREQLRRLSGHPVIGRVWRFWKRWVNHDLP